MKTNNIKIIFILLLAIMIVPAQADVFPAEPFNGLQIVYSISGATLETPEDVGGFTTSRTIKGAITGDTLTVSGTAKASGGYGATLDVTVSVEGQEDKIFHQEKFPAEGLAKDPMSQEFSISLPVPPSAKTASFSIDMVGDYNAGTRGLVVSGKLDRSVVITPKVTVTPADQIGVNKRLCIEAMTMYDLSPEDADGYNLKMDYDSIKKDFEMAIDLYNQNHNIKAHSSDNFFGMFGAISWLSVEGGIHESTSKKFVFTSDDDRQKFARTKILPGRPEETTKGSEYALYYSIKTKYKEKGDKKLSPGDILYLSMEQRNGDVSEAMLLAHNALRSMARGADQSLTLLLLEPDFFDKYLEPMIYPAILGREQNSGAWYHLFGTAYYEMQGRGNWGIYTPIEMIIDRTIGDSLGKLMNQLYNDPKVENPATRSSLSFLSNEIEQYFKSGPRDPEKYCYNVWGAQLGAWLYRYKLPKEGLGISSGDDSSTEDKSIIIDPIWGPVVPISGSTRSIISGSPVNIIWEGDGQRMELDQVQGTIRGRYPVGLVPFYEEKTESWGVLWKELDNSRYNVIFDAFKEGWHHIIIVDGPSEKTLIYSVFQQPGERSTLSIDPSSSYARMLDQQGQEIKPLVLSNNKSGSTGGWVGKWNTDWGIMTINQTGNSATGNYEHDSGKIVGTVSGNMIKGTWSESPSYNPPGDAGDIEFTLDEDSFTGKWRYGSSGDWSGWNGKRITTKKTYTVPISTYTKPIPTYTKPIPTYTKPIPIAKGIPGVGIVMIVTIVLIAYMSRKRYHKKKNLIE